MISTLKLNTMINTDYNATTYKSHTVSGSSVSIPLYIPALMPKIPKGGSPKSSNIIRINKKMFINEKQKPILTKTQLKGQNFMTATVNIDTAFADINSSVQMISGYIGKNIVKKYHSVSSRGITFTINKGSVVRCKFLNNKISKLAFYTTKETSYKTLLA